MMMKTTTMMMMIIINEAFIWYKNMTFATSVQSPPLKIIENKSWYFFFKGYIWFDFSEREKKGWWNPRWTGKEKEEVEEKK